MLKWGILLLGCIYVILPYWLLIVFYDWYLYNKMEVAPLIFIFTFYLSLALYDYLFMFFWVLNEVSYNEK